MTRPLSLSAMARPAATTALGVGLAAGAAALASPWLAPPSLALFFVPPVLVVAIRHGFAAALLTSLLGAATVNFLFVEPRHTFVIGRAEDAAALAIFAIVAALSSAVAARARAARRSAEIRAAQAVVLQDVAIGLGGAPDRAAIAAACAAALRRLGAGRALVVAVDGRSWGEGCDAAAALAARWAMSTKRAFAPGPDAACEAPFHFWPVVVQGEPVLALGVDGAPGLEATDAAEQVAALAGLALARVAAAQRAERARTDMERERLKSDLLAGVSHDLRTPLSTILFTLQSLQRFDARHAPETRAELISLAEGEARRLSAMVESLLDASRIGAAGAPVRLAALAPESLIRRARDSLALEDTPQSFMVTSDPALPQIAADVDLATRALANIVANAVRHGGGRVEVSAARERAAVRIDVRDHGSGMVEGRADLFEPFVRGRSDDGRPPGLGLGLSLALTFLKAQGASVTAGDAPGGGALFSLRFPLAGDDLAHAE